MKSKSSRCKICLVKPTNPKVCSGCKTAVYCSTNCQRADWRGGDHRVECNRLKEAATKLKTQFGLVDEAEIVQRLFQLGPGTDLIGKVMVASASVIAKAQPNFKDVRITLKEGKAFVDVLTCYCGNEDITTLNCNRADQFFQEVFNICLRQEMAFACDESAQDYLTVVKANLESVKAIISSNDSRDLMDRLDILIHGLHWQNVNAFLFAARAKNSIGDHETAVSFLKEGMALLDHMQDSSFSSPRDQIQLNDVRTQFQRAEGEMCHMLIRALEGQIPLLSREKAVTKSWSYRELGLAQLQSGDPKLAEAGRKNLNRSLNLYTKIQDSNRDLSDFDYANLMSLLGEAYHLCALWVVPFEKGKTAADVVKWEQKALNCFVEANDKDRMLKSNTRLFNWKCSGSVSTRWFPCLAAPGFDVRLKVFKAGDSPLSFNFTGHLREIRSLISSKTTISDECGVCQRGPLWSSADEDTVEILVGCQHVFHVSCLNFYKEENNPECPICRVIFAD